MRNTKVVIGEISKNNKLPMKRIARTILFMMSLEGHRYERVRDSLPKALANTGGLATSLFYGLTFLYVFFMGPYIDLKLAKHFSFIVDNLTGNLS